MAITEGVLTIQTTGQPSSVGDIADIEWIILSSPLGNNFVMRVGSRGITLQKGYELVQGKKIRITAKSGNLSNVYVVGHSGDKIEYTYREKGIDNELTSRILLEQLLEQLKNMNIQLSLVTDNELEVK